MKELLRVLLNNNMENINFLKKEYNWFLTKIYNDWYSFYGDIIPNINEILNDHDLIKHKEKDINGNDFATCLNCDSRIIFTRSSCYINYGNIDYSQNIFRIELCNYSKYKCHQNIDDILSCKEIVIKSIIE